MKVLQVVQFFSRCHGGSATVPFEIAKGLCGRGHDVTVLTTDYRLDDTFTKNLSGVDVVPAHCDANLGGFLVSRSMRRYLEANLTEFDIVHLHNYRTYQNVVVSECARKCGIPYLLQAHGSTPVISGKRMLKSLYDLMYGRSVLDGAARLIAVSSHEQDHYTAMGQPLRKICLIPNIVDASEFEHLPARGSLRTRLGIGGSTKIILYLGRLHVRKGIDVLIRAFGKAAGDVSDAVLVIVGPDDGCLAGLKKLTLALGLADKVRFLGYVENRLEAYVDADVLVYPAEHEIFGLVPLEAIMCRTPVIVTDDCGCGDLISLARGGHLVRYGDAAGLSEKIRHVLDNPAESRAMVESGRAYIEGHLSPRRIIDDLAAVYEACLQSP